MPSGYRNDGDNPFIKYINYVADRFDLRKDIQLSSSVCSCIFDERTSTWTTTTVNGEKFTSQYMVMATGCLSIPQSPKFQGLENFKGKWYHSADWPREGVDFTGKRVGLIGTGSSGVQMTPEIARCARQLTVFQRTANYSVPAQNEPITPEQLAEAKSNYGARRARAMETHTAYFGERDRSFRSIVTARDGAT